MFIIFIVGFCLTYCRNTHASNSSTRDSDSVTSLSPANSLLLFNLSSFHKLPEIRQGFSRANRSSLSNRYVTGQMPFMSANQRESTEANSSFQQDQKNVGPPTGPDERLPVEIREKQKNLVEDRVVNGVESRPSLSSMKRNDSAADVPHPRGGSVDDSRRELSSVALTTVGPNESNNQTGLHSRTINSSRDFAAVLKYDTQLKAPVGEQPSSGGVASSQKVTPEPRPADDDRGDGNLASSSRLHSEPGHLQDHLEPSINTSVSRNSSAVNDAGGVSHNGRTVEDAATANVPQKEPAPLSRSINIVVDNSTLMSTDRTPSNETLDRVRSQVISVSGTNSSLPVSEISSRFGERNISSVGSNDSAEDDGMKDLTKLGKIGLPVVSEIQPSNGTATNSRASVMGLKTEETRSEMSKGEEYHKDEVVSDTDTGKSRDAGQRMVNSRLQPMALEEVTAGVGGGDKLLEHGTAQEQEEISIDDHRQRRLQFLVSKSIILTSPITIAMHTLINSNCPANPVVG